MNIATQIMIVTGARICKSTDPATGIDYGGVYYPAHSKNGKAIPARWCGMLAINEKPYFKGNEKVNPCQYIPLVVWNNKNTETKGMADIFAKCASKGKEISAHLFVKSFLKRIFDNNQPLLKANGDAITYNALDFTLKDNLIFGDDSGKLVKRETEMWNGNPSFESRPPLWNVMGHADQKAWSEIVVPSRMSATYTGGPSFGYARVIVPAGVQLLNTPPQPVAQAAPIVLPVATPIQAAPITVPIQTPLPEQGAAPTDAAQQLMANPPQPLTANASTPL